MKSLLTTCAFLSLMLATPTFAQQVSLAEDSVTDLENSGTARWAHTFIEALDQKGWDTETFPVNTIGGEDERLDQIRSGILDVSMSDYQKAVQFDPEMLVLRLPYLFKSQEQFARFMTESDFLDTANEKLAGDDLRVLAIVPLGPFMAIFNNKKEVKTADDMKGLRMRALDESQMVLFKALGASGVVIPFAEVPNAIQTGVADGYVNPLGVPLTFGQADLFTNATDARVFPSMRVALASLSWWNGLSDEEKAQVTEAAATASKDVLDWVPKVHDRQVKDLEKAGVAVYEPKPEELQTFRDATAGMSKDVANVDQARVDEIIKSVDGYAQ
ncbi:TRAP transporter substrate-binding protein [Jiella mangrovi]|uniref:TRAP transporter substrate-binding protein n=1 Tax=Jiella mangrovi TaxID=2821407 RepID=A0ABS4BEC2_9HYPH|nr:TRAP transporter substrate-binding protein [Jiella mangrovi]MBP0615101.1 TRAP transporter substrate-binding protein [Jiella mangrovi]